MTRIKKYTSQSGASDLEDQLNKYLDISQAFRRSRNIARRVQRAAPLGAMMTLAAAALPGTANTQCLISNSAIDFDEDGNADLFISSFQSSSGYGGNYTFIQQIRAVPATGVSAEFFGGGPGFPRLCYFANCIFPYANGATAGTQVGNIGVLFSSQIACQRNQVTSQSCQTFTTSEGSTYTSCFTNFFTSTTCADEVVNGNFTPSVSGTLAVRIDNNMHFVEIVVYGQPQITHIDGMTAQSCSPLPVRLTEFTGRAQADHIRLKWTASQEIHHQGYELQRSENGVDFKKIAWLEATKDTSVPNEYEFNDVGVTMSTTYYYRLRQVSLDGSFEYSKTISATTAEKSAHVSIGQLSPNPTIDGHSVLNLSVRQASDLRVSIFDSRGLEVRTYHQNVSEGNHAVLIDVEGLSSGTYFVKSLLGSEQAYRRLVIP